MRTRYGIERSLWRKLKAIATRVPTLLKSMRLVGVAGLNTGNLMPADFLIDGRGRIIEASYGRDAGDRIPLERIERRLPAKRPDPRPGPLAMPPAIVHHAGTTSGEPAT